MACISFELITFKHLYPFFMGFSFISQRALLKFGIQAIIKRKFPFFLSLLMYLGESLAFLIYYFKKKKEEEKNQNFLLENRNYRAVDEEKKEKNNNKIKIFLLIFLATAFDLIIYFLITFFLANTINQCSHDFLSNVYQVILSSIICYFWFKYKYYLHQKIGLIIMVIFIFIIFIYELITDEFHFNNSLILFCFNTLISFKVCLEKYLMSKKNLNPFYLLGLEGIIGIVLSFILLICATFIKIGGKNIDNIVKAFKSLGNEVMCLCSFGYIIIVCISNSLMQVTNLELAPTYLAFGFVMDSIFTGILDIIEESDILEKIIFIVSSSIGIFIGLLIYHEILILKCYGLDENIQAQIEERGYKEAKELEKDFEDYQTSHQKDLVNFN